MLKKIKAYFSTKKKKEAITKLVEIKAGFYKGTVNYTTNLNELYNVLYSTEVVIPDDVVLLRGVSITSMFKTSLEACEFVLDVVDKGVHITQLLYQNDNTETPHLYLDWRVNDYTLIELITLYRNFVYLFYLHYANKDGILSLTESKIYNRLTFSQVDFLKSTNATRLRDEAIDFYVLLLQLEIGS